MKYFGLLSFFLLLVSCATVPSEVKNQIRTNGYAGYWVNYKFDFGGKTDHSVRHYLNISCDGEIKYSIDEPNALFFKKDTDDGKIQQMKDGRVFVRSWTGFENSYSISTVSSEPNGCKVVRFKGVEFKTFYPTDCTKPQITFSQAFSDAYSHLKNNDYVHCE